MKWQFLPFQPAVLELWVSYLTESLLVCTDHCGDVLMMSFPLSGTGMKWQP